MAKAKLLEVFAPGPGMAAREAKRQWQDHIDFASAAGRAHARNGARTESHVTDNWWARLFALPDPCANESESEVVKREQILALLPTLIVPDPLELGCAEGHVTLRLSSRVD